MSDEEKKTIETTKTIIEYAGDSYIPKQNREKLKTLLNLIEKQSKEIEGLKEELADTINNVHKYFIAKDKIKAKIEFIKSLKEKIYYEENVISVLQSLLEKE